MGEVAAIESQTAPAKGNKLVVMLVAVGVLVAV